MDKSDQVPNPRIAALMQSGNQQLRYGGSSATPQNTTQYTQQFQQDFVASHYAQLSQQQYSQTNDPSLQLNQNFAINNNQHGSHDDSQNPPKEIKEQEMFLPKENIRKVMKKVLPTYAKISKEAVDCIQECATEFILFVLGEASDIAQNQKRKIVCGSHITEAFRTLGLEFYSSLMTTYLQQLKASQVISTKPKKRKRNKDVSESDEAQDEDINDPEDLYDHQETNAYQSHASNISQEVGATTQQFHTVNAMNTISNNNNSNTSTTEGTSRLALPTLEQLQELYRQLYPNVSISQQQPVQQNYQQGPASTYSQQLPVYPQQPVNSYPPQHTPSITQQSSAFHQQAPSLSYQHSPTTTYPQQPTYVQQPSTHFAQQPNAGPMPSRPAIPMEQMMSYLQHRNSQMNQGNPNSTQPPPNKRNG